MKVQRVYDMQPVIDHLASTLSEHLGNEEKVVWLVPGGSAIMIAAAVSQELAGQDLSRLTVTLTDERFGHVGHGDSNWRQLQEAGFVFDGVEALPVLTGKDMAETTTEFGTTLRTILGDADYTIGLFGMGADGHTAGVLPETNAVHSELYADSYDAGNFLRLTMTLKAIAELNETVLYAAGEEKLPALESLCNESVSLDKQPAQIHKQVPKSTLFTDQNVIINERL